MTAPAPSSTLRALRLQSPDTDRRLFGLDGDCVFSAPGASVAHELVGVDLCARELLAAQPSRAVEGLLFWLPFWQVRFRAEVSGEGPAVAVVQTVFDSSRAYVRAFSLVNALYVGDPGLGLTLEGVELEAREGPPPVCLGARLPSREAVTIARLFLLEKADRISDVTGARVKAEVAELRLMMIPFDRRDRSLHLLVGPPTRFREETVVDLRGIEDRYADIARALR